MGVLIPLVARAGVLAEVGSVLTAARAGRGALLTVTGEPGIGKTRLAEEAAGQADGFEVIWTWCPAAAGGAALRPWSRVVRVLAGGHTAVARLIADSPFLAALADPARSGNARDPEGARSQLSFDLAEVFAIAAAKRPVLVVIDDAHQADVSSLRLLAELAPALRTMPAAVLVTARDGDRDWHGRLDMRTALLRSGDVISLQPLAEGDVAAVVAGVTGAPVGPDLVAVIAERSAGNPFLVTELARQLGGQNAEPAAARAIVPDSVRALAGARVGELTGTARDVVLAASVLGTGFRRDVLAGLAGLEPGELAAAGPGSARRPSAPAGPGGPTCSPAPRSGLGGGPAGRRPRPFRFHELTMRSAGTGRCGRWPIRGREIRIRDSKGLRDLHALLARPGTAVAALDLAAAPGGHRAGASAGPDVLHPPSDTGEVIDAQARAAYRQRLSELDEAAAEADAAADIERTRASPPNGTPWSRR